MLNDWTDKMTDAEAADHWRRLTRYLQDERARRVEHELSEQIEAQELNFDSFFQAMRHFLLLREKLFPGFPADPAWKILVTLARTPEGDPKSTITGIIYGADVPQATALRYISAMVERGIIERVPDPRDTRRAYLRLTPEGRARLEQIANRWKMRLLWSVLFPAAVALVAGAAFAMTR